MADFISIMKPDFILDIRRLLDQLEYSDLINLPLKHFESTESLNHFQAIVVELEVLFRQIDQ